MTLTLGSLTLSDGTRLQPWRLVSSNGARHIESATRIRASDVAILDRKNRSFTDTIELSRTWSSVADCVSGALTLQSQMLALQPSVLSYGSTQRGTACVSSVSLDIFGCSCMFTITLDGTLTIPAS